MISGSLRAGSTNTAAIRTAERVLPPGCTATVYAGMGSLPHFNPDDDREGASVPPAVADLRARVAEADAIVICTPEYAGALPGALKNLLEWTVGDGGTYDKPVAWINVAGPAAPTGAADAHDSLGKVLGYVHADVVEAACLRLPLTRDALGDDGIIADPAARERIAAMLAALIKRARRADREPVADPTRRPGDALGMEPDEMRRLGHWVVDRVVDHFAHGAEGPAIVRGGADELRDALGGPLPQEPGDALEAMHRLTDVALANMQHGDHPRFFARVPGPSSFTGVLGEWLGTGFNAIAASWAGGSGPATVELVVLDWLREAIGLPEGTDGVLVSGGSLASITALAAARAHAGPGVAYLSDQTHSSIGRGLHALGFAGEQIRVLASGADLRLGIDALERAIAEDRAAGRRPGFVVATAGTTNTGAVDPLPELADLSAREGLWLHVDGAYGAPAALCERGRGVLDGMQRADSLVLDPHKWLFAPYDVGCVFVRPGVLDAAFHMDPEYLLDVRARSGEVDLRNRSLELSRRSRALKLWLTIQTHGMRGIAAAIERGIELAERAEALIRADRRWTIVTPAQLGIVTFALDGADDAEHATRAARLADDGYAAVTTTTLHGRSALRLCTINPRTTESDLRETLERLSR